MKLLFQFLVLVLSGLISIGQQPITGSFVAKLGNDTVIVETYNLLENHLFGKAFLRYPEDQVGVFNFHFYPDGSIRHYSISLMKPDSSYITSSGNMGVMCAGDTCTCYASWPGASEEYTNSHAAKQMDFIGGWTPTLSLIEWNCMRLIKSGKQSLPLTMLNDYIGVRHVSISKGNKDTIIFGGPFLEYTKIVTTPEGRILSYDGTGTPWNYIATKHEPIDVDIVARRLSKSPKIGIPSPEIEVKFPISNDTITLSYGRPSMRGRKIFGGVVPYDSVWRTGASHPTRIILPYKIKFGQTEIPAGAYSLYTIPRPDGWTLIFNTDLKQWPTDPNREKDFAEVPLQVKKTNTQTEMFTIEIDKLKNAGGIIRFIWEQTEAFAEFKVLKQ